MPQIAGSSTINPQEFGQLQGQVQALTELLRELRREVKDLTTAVENAKGGWKAALFLGGLAASVGAFLAKFGSALADAAHH